MFSPGAKQCASFYPRITKVCTGKPDRLDPLPTLKPITILLNVFLNFLLLTLTEHTRVDDSIAAQLHGRVGPGPAWRLHGPQNAPSSFSVPCFIMTIDLFPVFPCLRTATP